MYETLKLVHLVLAALSIGGFILRGYWMIVEPALLQRRWVRIAPHVLDTFFLLSGLALLMYLGLGLAAQAWLQSKLAALVVYILLGTVALRRGRTKRGRVFALALAILTLAYIVGVAILRSPGSWLTLAGR